MAIQVSGTQVIGNSRELTNIASVDATTVATLNAGGVGGGGFEPVAVTGTTPSLDVGTYNFFDNGTLTADTTISFASVPTNANWKYSFKPTIASGAWDVSTASYSQNFSVASQEPSPQGIFFKPDGTKMYVVGYLADAVNEYDLSTAWDITSASYLQNFSVSAQDTFSQGIFFKPDGLKMYVVGQTGQDVNEYDLSTAWDVTSASYSQNFSVASQETVPQGIFFKPDGLKMYVIGYTGDDVNEYDLSTAWDVTSASYLQNFSVSAQEATPQGIFFKPDGLKMYVVGASGADVNEYDLGTATAITLPAAVVGTPTATYYSTAAAGSRVTYDFFTMDGGTTVNLIGEEII